MSAETYTPSGALEETTRDMSHLFNSWVTNLVSIYKKNIQVYNKNIINNTQHTVTDNFTSRYYKNSNNTEFYLIYNIYKFSDCSFLCLILFTIHNTQKTHVHIELTYVKSVSSSDNPIGKKSTDWIDTRNTYINNNGLHNTAGIFYGGPNDTKFLLGGPEIYVNIKELLRIAVNVIHLPIFLVNLITPITPTSAVSKYMYALYVIQVYAIINTFADEFPKKTIMLNRTAMDIRQALQFVRKEPNLINTVSFDLFSKKSIIYDFIFVYALIFPYNHKGKLYNWLTWVINLIDDYAKPNSKCKMFNDIALDYLIRYPLPYGTYPRTNPPVNEPLDKMYNASINTLTNINVKWLDLYNHPINIEFIDGMM